MEHHTVKVKALIVPVLIIIFINTCILEVHSLILASPPSPAPAPSPAYEGRKAKAIRVGSLPVTCHSKCNECRPCVPVEVSIRTMELEEENQYYPIAWRCMCHSNIFSP
ncbi:hypothetical protein Lal_00017605 [Lupinus albus]|uniref:Epidermal patterning factor-like protein n=1 Tax=Lupinus albus TaxID=3870 RepID=A0A6A5MH28_LUPAL|nr:hypothetical protein Lalb_Chr04g0263751 [Lupinus albus]KAF1870025.1 hypothetical protein Lal_00017605 [Lupinus albus]